MFIYLFFTWSESLYGSLRAGKAKEIPKPCQLHRTPDGGTFPIVHKECKSTNQIKKGIKSKRLHYIFMLRRLYWVQHSSTLFLQEAIRNLFIHRGNESFPVVFEPAVMTQREKWTKEKMSTFLNKKSKRLEKPEPSSKAEAKNKYQNWYQPSERDKAVPPHVATWRLKGGLCVCGLAWPDLVVFFVCRLTWGAAVYP